MSKADTNQASELYELCKKVYELTGWGEPSLPCWIDNATKKHAQQGYPKVTKYVGIRGKWEYGKQYGLYIMYPLYTSDYLLERLPRYEIVDNGVMATASFYDSDKDAWYYGDDRTALKALLKLVIALEKAGVEL